jgi:iron(III) transport system substrate-binding protein
MTTSIIAERSNKANLLTFTVLIFLLSGVLTSCSHNSKKGTKSTNQSNGKQELTLYNGQHKRTAKALVDAFEAKTNIKVNVRNGSSSELANQIVEEGKKSPADLIYTEESPPLVMIAEKGLLGKIDGKTVKQIPNKYVGKNNRWIGVSARTRVVVYNPSKIKEDELPASVLDFAKPKWKGKIGFVPTSGAFQEQITAIIKLKGKDAAKKWLEGLKAYGERYNHNMSAMNAVERGDIPAALINNYYWYIVKEEKGADNMESKLYYFDNHDVGGLITVSGAAMLKSSDNKEAAQRFLHYMVSTEGQKVIEEASEEYPLDPDVQNKDLKPFDELAPPDITPAELGDGKDALKLEQEVGLI